MNKTAIKNFAVWARRKLIADITYKAGLIGVSENGITQPLPQSTNDLQFFDIGTKDYAQVAGAEIVQRNALVRAIQEKEHTSDYETAFKAVIEEVAYTWFNRLIAIRFMEVNEYLPSRIRVLSSENPAKNEPDFVTTPFDTDMEFTMTEQDKIMQLKDENKLDDLFRMLFIKQCNKLHEILPELFEETNNYTELLLSISFTDNDGIVYHLVHDIPEDDFNVEKEGQVEIIGWMYQYYNIEPKDETFALLKKNVKITKERIPAATQLFTPDWIVRYMVENSLGRLWVEGHPSDSLKENWKYYLEEAEQEPEVVEQLEQIRAEYRNLNPEDIKVIDPCMGSGHILVYCFDVLMQIYESQGYTQRDAAQSILENNLFGLDIDKRAAQLAYFAVMMKARQYDRRILTRDIKPHVYAIEESNGINRNQLKYFGINLSSLERNIALNEINELLDTLTDAKEYGSILNVENYDWKLLHRFAENIDAAGQMSLDTIGIDQTQAQLLALIEIAHVMAQKYEVVVTNPPYMGAKGMSRKLGDYIKSEYPLAKTDIFACFIKRGFKMLKPYGFNTQVTMQVWMFLTAFDKFREELYQNSHIVSLLHMDNMVMGIAFGTSATIFRAKPMPKYNGRYSYVSMSDITNEIPIEFPVKNARLCNASISSMSRIPRKPVAYWASAQNTGAYSVHKALEDYADVKKGMSTADDERFLRLWHEIGCNKFHVFTQEAKWFRLNKGGAFRRWYGNNEYVVNWENNGLEMKEFKNAVIRNEQYYLRPMGLTWTYVTNYKLNVRFCENALFAAVGPSIFPRRISWQYVLGLLNTKVAQAFADNVGGETITYEVGEVASIPVACKDDSFINNLVEDNVALSKTDWNSFETSWDFLIHPLVLAANVPDLNGGHKATLADSYAKWEALCENRFNQLKANEEELNRIFIDIYGLQDELTPEVEDKDVTVRKADLDRDIRSLLSYAVGCMFGRYSLDEQGLAYAGGEWNSSKYSIFIPDRDNCIPITDEAYFEDDIVGLFINWMKKTFGEENLEENLDFIAKALGNKGTTSREVIRNYFLNDFIKDHIKIYQKRPIYWLFDSGKKDGFKALVYMHRWNADTVGNVRVEYLHKMQHIYEREIQRMQENIDNSNNSKEIAKVNKRKEKLQKQLKEAQDYDAKLAHIALSRIDIDLDDGVKVNYEKVQTGRDGKKMQILAKL